MAWIVTLAINPILASHVAFAFLAVVAFLIAGTLLSAPLWFPLGVLALALVTGNSIANCVGSFKDKLLRS